MTTEKHEHIIHTPSDDTVYQNAKKWNSVRS